MPLSAAHLTRLSIAWVGKAYKAFVSKVLPSSPAPTVPPKIGITNAQAIYIRVAPGDIITSTISGYAVTIGVEDV